MRLGDNAPEVYDGLKDSLQPGLQRPQHGPQLLFLFMGARVPQPEPIPLNAITAADIGTQCSIV